MDTFRKVNGNTFVVEGTKITVRKDGNLRVGEYDHAPQVAFSVLTKRFARRVRKGLRLMGYPALAAVKRAG